MRSINVTTIASHNADHFNRKEDLKRHWYVSVENAKEQKERSEIGKLHHGTDRNESSDNILPARCGG